jgi:hypothetical protein
MKFEKPSNTWLDFYHRVDDCIDHVPNTPREADLIKEVCEMYYRASSDARQVRHFQTSFIGRMFDENEREDDFSKAVNYIAIRRLNINFEDIKSTIHNDDRKSQTITQIINDPVGLRENVVNMMSWISYQVFGENMPGIVEKACKKVIHICPSMRCEKRMDSLMDSLHEDSQRENPVYNTNRTITPTSP